MKKIGILTFHRSTNNGAVMQCFALSQKLKKDFPGCEVEVIDYHMPRVDYKIYPDSLAKFYKGSSMRVFLSKTKRLIKNPLMLRRQKQKNLIFGEIVTFLPLSETKIFDNDVKRLFEYINDSYDVVIAGSDAIWNYTNRGFPNPYFLDSKIKAKKISYAASCYGMDYENIPLEHKQSIKRILDTYAFIGVRDSESEKFAREIDCLAPIAHTCDPTLLLDLEDMPVNKDNLEEKMKKEGFVFDKKAVCVMGNPQMCNMVKNLFGNSYQIVSLFNYSKDADVNLYKLNPFEWAYVFRYFDLTFTTYFHGTLLSLKNGTPVICFALDSDYNKPHMSKTLDVLKRLNMEDCYFYTDYISENIVQIKKKAEALLLGDMSGFIRKQIEKEAESYDVFLSDLRKAIILK